MPTKHIDDLTWKKVQEERVKAVVLTKMSIKDTEILKILIKKGLDNVTDDDYINFANKKESKWDISDSLTILDNLVEKTLS